MSCSRCRQPLFAVSRPALWAAMLALCATLAAPRWVRAADYLQVDADGTVHVPAERVPVSKFLSPQGQAYLAEHLQQVQRPEMLVQKDGVPPLLAGYLARQRQLYAVKRQEVRIAGVHAYVYTPTQGVAPQNRQRVLIDLHGGGFTGCWPGCAELESMPIAALGRIEVISVDYRQAPQFRFPAASEDVAAVYRDLLKTHQAQEIGIYGCSAGGMLTGEVVAWLQRHDLPKPGAVAIMCAGLTAPDAGFGGDADYTAMPLGEARLTQPPAPRPAQGAPPVMNYFAGANLRDPLVSPAVSPEVLAKFPPTLIITGTRGFELSSAVYSHSLLDRYGVTAELHVWEGMFHGFFYNPDVPESRDCYAVVNRFFDRYLKGP